MNILIFTGGLEPKRSGVSDYCRLLAEQLKGYSNVTVCLLSYHDRNVNTVTHDEKNVIRIPAAYSSKKRFAFAQQFIKAQNPDYISMQFVAFGFHKYGLPFYELLFWKKLFKDRKLQINFHELWVGRENLKMWLLGSLQARLIQLMVKVLIPNVIHTSNPFYQEKLSEKGIDARILPLPSNIPDYGKDNNASMKSILYNHDLANKSDNAYIGIIFGSIPPQWNPSELLSFLNNEASNTPKQVILLGIGNQRDDSRLQQLINNHFTNIYYIKTGVLPEQKISHLLHSAHFAITPHPLTLIGKSGTVAAYKKHGLPILFSGNKLKTNLSNRILADYPYLFYIKGENNFSLDEIIRQKGYQFHEPDFVYQFINDIKNT